MKTNLTLYYLALAGLVAVSLMVFTQPAQTQNTWLTMHALGTTVANGVVLERRAADTFTICADFTASTTAGVITIEESGGNDGSSYSGTWSSLGTISWVVADAMECVHLASAPYGAIRARISTEVANGTGVNVYGRANQ